MPSLFANRPEKPIRLCCVHYPSSSSFPPFFSPSLVFILYPLLSLKFILFYLSIRAISLKLEGENNERVLSKRDRPSLNYPSTIIRTPLIGEKQIRTRFSPSIRQTVVRSTPSKSPTRRVSFDLPSLSLSPIFISPICAVSSTHPSFFHSLEFRDKWFNAYLFFFRGPKSPPLPAVSHRREARGGEREEGFSGRRWRRRAISTYTVPSNLWRVNRAL